MKKVRKTLYTLALKGYAPELIEVTFKLMRKWAEKIEAEFYVIEDRKFNLYPTYEKFQIYELSKERDDDFIYFLDADTMVHPDMYDPMTIITKEWTCAAYSNDYTPMRFRPDEMFLRDARYQGKGSWCIFCSDWTRDIWQPLPQDITYEEAVANIFPVNHEVNSIKKTPESLIDDYLVSRNIAKYGLKHTTISEIGESRKIPFTVNITQQGQLVGSPMLQHDYNRSLEGKIVWTEQLLNLWGVTL